MDSGGKARYANQRGIRSDFIGDANGSDKHYSFGIPATVPSDTLNLFESAIDAPDKSSGRRLQEIEIIYNHIGELDHSKVTLWKGNAV